MTKKSEPISPEDVIKIRDYFAQLRKQQVDAWTFDPKRMRRELKWIHRFCSRDHAIFEIGIHCGYRISEILSLRIKDVAFFKEGKFSHILPSVNVEARFMKGKKGVKKNRTVMLHERVRQILRDYIENWSEIYHTNQYLREMQPNYPLFPSQMHRNTQPLARRAHSDKWRDADGRPEQPRVSKMAAHRVGEYRNLETGKVEEIWVSSISDRGVAQIFKEIFSLLRINSSGTHFMRKTFSTAVYEDSGKDLSVLKTALGHKNISSTISYLNVDGKMVDKLVMNLDFSKIPEERKPKQEIKEEPKKEENKKNGKKTEKDFSDADKPLFIVKNL
jgi:integrase